MPPFRPMLVIAAFALGPLMMAENAGARVEAESGYTKKQTYSAALRYLRVDLGYEVLEKDPEAAYLIFRYTTPHQTKDAATGTVEIVATESSVKLFVQIPRMPEYHERVLRDGLMKKLRDEYGAPPPKAREKPPEKPPASDAGTD